MYASDEKKSANEKEKKEPECAVGSRAGSRRFGNIQCIDYPRGIFSRFSFQFASFDIQLESSCGKYV